MEVTKFDFSKVLFLIFVFLTIYIMLQKDKINSPDCVNHSLCGVDCKTHMMGFIFCKMNTSKEVFRDIHGYEGLYQANNLGMIKSIGYGKIRILSQSLNSNGYNQLNLCKEKIRRLWKVHQLIAITFIPNPNKKPHINHKNGIKTDNRVDNLEWCTQSENGIHAYKIGLRKPVSGINHPSSKLTMEQVSEIRSKYVPCKYSLNMLSREYGIDKSIVFGIIKNKRYAV